MNNPDHISESVETIFWVKILKLLMRTRDRKNSDPGSGLNIPDPQHCSHLSFATTASLTHGADSLRQLILLFDLKVKSC
jgi:hypothetical protein